MDNPPEEEAAAPEPESGRKPNIIYILADDLGIGDLGCYGQTRIRTPNLDRLAAEGMRFTRHYSGSTVCAPSRCCLMTGLHTGHAFIRDNRETEGDGQFPLPAGTVTVAQLLRDAGYATAVVGKWGLGNPESSGAPLKQYGVRFPASGAWFCHYNSGLAAYAKDFDNLGPKPGEGFELPPNQTTLPLDMSRYSLLVFSKSRPPNATLVKAAYAPEIKAAAEETGAGSARVVEDYVEEPLEPFPYIPVPLPAEWHP